MSIDNIWDNARPKITDQFIAMGNNVLIIRNNSVADAAFMAKMQVCWNYILFISAVSTTLPIVLNDPVWAVVSFSAAMIFILFICIFIYIRINTIKRHTNFIFNRKLKKIFMSNSKALLKSDWNKISFTTGGVTTFGGSAFTTNYFLMLEAFDAKAEGQSKLYPTTSIFISSNEPGDPRLEYVAEVWRYIHQFMEKGPKDLPLPTELNWWNVPQNNICLTPAQAFRHYAPWRTGEPGEMQAKSNWLLPLWIVLFPYNMFSALCWWITCKLFRVRQAEIPAEALEGETGPLITLEMAIKGERS